MPRSIRTKLLLSHFALVLIGALAFGSAGYLLLLRELQSTEGEKLKVTAAMAAQETEAFLQRQQRILIRIGEGREILEFSKNQRIQPLVDYLGQYKESFPKLSYWNTQDKRAAAGRDTAAESPQQAVPDEALQHLAQQKPGEVHSALRSGRQGERGAQITMVLGVKEHFSGQYIGLLQGEIPLQAITLGLEKIPIDQRGHILLLDRAGKVLYVSNYNLDAATLDENGESWLDRLTLLDNGRQIVAYLDSEVLASHAHTTSNGWTLVAVLPAEEFMVGPNQLRTQYLLILLAIAAGGSALASLMAIRITGPLLAVAAASRAVAAGKLATIPPVHSRDEVGALVESFNRMISELQATTVSRDQLDNILGSLHDALIVVGADGVVRMVNRACCELFVLPQEAIIGRPFDAAFGNRLLDFDSFSDLQQLEEQSSFETWLHDSDGRKIPLAISVSPLRHSESAEGGMVLLVQDISERKVSEEKVSNARNFLETVLNSMEDAISIVDATSLRVVGANQVFLKRAEHSEFEVLGCKCYEMALHDCPAERRNPEGCPVLRTVASGAPASSEYAHRGADGREIFVEVKTSPIKNSAGEVTSVVHVARDISERKRAEQEQQAFAATLAASNRELTDFAYVASHDLQEPLRKVTAFGDRLKSRYAEALGEQGLDYVERMRHAAVRMQTLIDDLLSFSRVTTKAQPFVPVALTAITREVLVDLEIRIQELHAVVEVSELPTIEADPLQMRQLLQNLIGNALKFHRPGVPPSIQVQGKLSADGKHCRLTITDNGIGFEVQHSERIFGVFQRLHGRNEYVGSGVGLAICRKITERHHGSVTATSGAGGGAVFTVTLPVIQE